MPDLQERILESPASPVDAHLAVVDVSVCIANWNCRDVLRNCLRSLFESEGVKFEVIVVDNASTDGAADMVAEEFPQVRLIRNEDNRGFARANNQAAQAATGHYVLFLNNDTVVGRTALARLVDYARQHPDAGMIGPRLREPSGKIQVSCRPRPRLGSFLHRTLLFRWLGLWRSTYHEYRRNTFDAETTRPVEVLMGAAVLLARRDFWAWGAWDEQFAFGGEDLELSYRVNRHAAVVYVPEVEITHLGRVSTRQHLAFTSPRIAVGFAQYLRKTGTPWVGLWLYKLALTLDAPLQVVVKSMQYAWRRLRGQRERAEKSRLAACSFGHFLLRGLIPLWRA